MLSQTFQIEINLIFQKHFQFTTQEQYGNENLQTKFPQEQKCKQKKSENLKRQKYKRTKMQTSKHNVSI